MNRWLTALVLVVGAGFVSLASASPSPTTRPDGIPANVYQSASSIRWQMNPNGFDLKKLPDLSTYLSESDRVIIGSLKLPANLDLKGIPDVSTYLDGPTNAPSDKFFGPGVSIVTQNSLPKFDPTATLHVPQFQFRTSGLNPHGPSYLFNGMRVYSEPVQFAPQAASAHNPTTQK
jgi:hypothetical protein